MTPDYRLTANDLDITATIRRHLTNIEYSDSAGIESDSLTITLADDGTIKWPNKGAVLDFWLGYESQLNYKGKFIVTELDHTGPPDNIIMHATASDTLSSAKSQNSVNWSGWTYGQIINKIALDMGLIPVVSGSLKSISHGSLYQIAESDLHFLTRLAGNNGAIAQAKGGRLLFVQQGLALTASGDAMPSVAINRSQSSGHSYEERGRNEYTRTAATYYQVQSEMINGREIPIRRYYIVYSGTGSSTYHVPGYSDSKESAQRAADAARLGLDRSASKFSIDLAAGIPSLTAETLLIPTGFRTRIAELEWVIEQVTHNLDGGGGLTTSLSAVRLSTI